MRFRRFVIAWCVLLSASPMFAQTRATKAKADPISGTWTGTLARQSASDPIPVTMELKFDGKSTVSGTASGLPSPAEVKSGAFDPKTGALKLQLGKTGEGAVLLVLDGTLVKGTATGHFTGEESGEFKITKKDAKPSAR